jgi:hypothetical protein
MHHRLLLLAAALALPFAPATRAAETAPFAPEVQHRLDLLKTGYETYLLKTADVPFEEKLQQLNTQVRPLLERESAAAAQRKDLDALVRIKADIERLDQGQALTTTDAPPPAALQPLYTTYRQEFDKLTSAQKASRADAKQRYDKGLTQVQDDLTTQQEVAAALRVKQLREALVSSEPEAAAPITPATLPEVWTYHKTADESSVAVIHFLPDGRFEYDDSKGKHTGTWKAGKRPHTLTAKFDAEVWQITVTGATGTIERPGTGTRYMKVKNLAPGSPYLFVGKSFFSQAGSEYHFNQDGTGTRMQKMDFEDKVPFTWTQHPDGTVEILQRKQPTATPRPAYFRFIDPQTAFLGDVLSDINSKLRIP